MFALRGEQVLVSTACMLAVLVLIVFVHIGQKRAQKEMLRQHDLLQKKLSGLDFIHAVLVGKGRHQTGDDRVWCDALHTVVIAHKREPCALIGFSLSDEGLSIVQMQGIRGKKLFGLELGPLLLSYGEVIARKLGKQCIRVQPAFDHDYFELSEESYMYPHLYAHQKRMRAMYDASAKAKGYEEPISGYRWWHKTLRKKITFSRLVRLQFILFNRSARESLPFMPVQDGYGD